MADIWINGKRVDDTGDEDENADITVKGTGFTTVLRGVSGTVTINGTSDKFSTTVRTSGKKRRRS
ncbi:hypothetical protein GCM10022223_46890 [Kineosporia mesophila]|uniref:Uncharacterized protein n=1 Tax=Kineosporia mesophila TaxID=566012 RepID=A0ABP7A3U5_9ACTN|nr:hypothetical protein [Kineosporia mesophila]MCD5353799.1 hypothetical protein [Kineosporia mesophila]